MTRRDVTMWLAAASWLFGGCEPTLLPNQAAWHGEAWRYDADGSERIAEHWLDRDGRPLLTLEGGDRRDKYHYAADGTVSRTSTWGITTERYDGDLLLEEVAVDYSGLTWRTVHRYDEQGHRIHTAHQGPDSEWTETLEWSGDLLVARIRRLPNGSIDEEYYADWTGDVKVSTFSLQGMPSPYVTTTTLDEKGRRTEATVDRGYYLGLTHHTYRYQDGVLREEIADCFERSDHFTYDADGRPESRWSLRHDDQLEEVEEWTWEPVRRPGASPHRR